MITETLLPSLAGLILLGIFWTLVVRKTRLSIAGGLLLTVLPVLAGNLYWFYACKPQRDEQKRNSRHWLTWLQCRDIVCLSNKNPRYGRC